MRAEQPCYGRYPRLWQPDNAGARILLILDLQADSQLRRA